LTTVYQRYKQDRTQTGRQRADSIGRTVLQMVAQKRFALCYLTAVLSATLMYCGQMVGWIKMPLGMEVGLGPGHIVLDGEWEWDPPPPRKGGRSPPIFGPCLLWPNGWMDQDTTWWGRRLDPGDVVLDGDSALPTKRGTSAHPHFSSHFAMVVPQQSGMKSEGGLICPPHLSCC